VLIDAVTKTLAGGLLVSFRRQPCLAASETLFYVYICYWVVVWNWLNGSLYMAGSGKALASGKVA
jgi:hypothetical protein